MKTHPLIPRVPNLNRLVLLEEKRNTFVLGGSILSKTVPSSFKPHNIRKVLSELKLKTKTDRL